MALWLAEQVKSWLDIATRTRSKFARDNGALVAGAISFFAFLSIFPLLLAAIGILGMVLGSPEEAERLILSVTRHYAVGAQARELIAEVVDGGNAATGVGILVLLWSGMTVMVMLERAMNVAWDVRESRGFLRSRAVGLFVFVGVGAMMLFSIGATAAVNYLAAREAGLIPGWSGLMTLSSYLIPFLVIVATFTLVYKILPFTHVQWKAAIVGGVFAGVLWEVALQVFTFYVINFASYSKIYGSLGAVILLLVWINYSSTIVILGAELASVIQERKAPERR